jgi:hypothetical protein
MEKLFEPESRKTCNPDHPRLLIIDGHNSHTTLRFLEYAESHNIIVICLPPHTTHRLQPCDVGVFGPLSKAWKKEVENCYLQWITVSRYNLVEVYARARVASFKCDTIQAAFRKSGIWPPNPDAIPAEAYGPSRATSTRVLLPGITPLPQALPNPSPEPDPTPSISPAILASPDYEAVSESPVVDGEHNAGTIPEADLVVSIDDPDNICNQSAFVGMENIKGIDNDVPVSPINELMPPPHGILIPEEFHLSSIPHLPPTRVERAVLWQHLEESHNRAIAMAKWIDAHGAWIKYYINENEQLRRSLHTKQNKPKARYLNTKARVLTREDQLAQLRADEAAVETKRLEKEAKAKERARKKSQKENTQPSRKRGRPKAAAKKSAEANNLSGDEGGSERGLDEGEYIPRIIGVGPARVNPVRDVRRLALAQVAQNTQNHEYEPLVNSLGTVAEENEADIPTESVRQTRASARALTVQNDTEVVANSPTMMEISEAAVPLAVEPPANPTSSTADSALRPKPVRRRPPTRSQPLGTEVSETDFFIHPRAMTR